MMERRRFLLTSLAGALAEPLAAGAQPATGKMYPLGILSPGGFASGHRIIIEVLRELATSRARTWWSSKGPPGAELTGPLAWHENWWLRHWMTLSALPSRVIGNVMPRILAVLRFTKNSKPLTC
jgi:hypothetical protein